MKSERILLRLALLTVFVSGPAFAGYFELSGNGSYYKYNNGQTLGEANNTTVQRLGAGIGYNFLGNASIEFKYTNSKNTDKYTQESLGESRIYRITRTSQFNNYGINLILNFADRKAKFRPFITGGLGYMIREDGITGTYEDSVLLDGQQALQFAEEDPVKSISADGGIGFKIYIVERIALEGSFNVFATDLDKEEIYLHYSAAGGLRVVF
ncbi:porin family protein [bacterium]|nr:porin family protein [bacterium]